jgi:hypothetical protein
MLEHGAVEADRDHLLALGHSLGFGAASATGLVVADLKAASARSKALPVRRGGFIM